MSGYYMPEGRLSGPGCGQEWSEAISQEAIERTRQEMVTWIRVVTTEMGESWARSEIFRNKPNRTQSLTGHTWITQ